MPGSHTQACGMLLIFFPPLGRYRPQSTQPSTLRGLGVPNSHPKPGARGVDVRCNSQAAGLGLDERCNGQAAGSGLDERCYFMALTAPGEPQEAPRGPRRAPGGPRGPQESPRRPQESPGRLQEAQGGSRRAPGGAVWEQFRGLWLLLKRCKTAVKQLFSLLWPWWQRPRPKERKIQFYSGFTVFQELFGSSFGICGCS